MIPQRKTRKWPRFLFASLSIAGIGFAATASGQNVEFHAPTVHASPGASGFFDVSVKLDGGPADVVGWDFELAISPNTVPGVTFTSADLAPGGLTFEHGSPVFTIHKGSVAANDFDNELTAAVLANGGTSLVRIHYAVDPSAPVPSSYSLTFGDDALNNITTSDLDALEDVEIAGALHVIPEPSSVFALMLSVFPAAGCARLRRR